MNYKKILSIDNSLEKLLFFLNILRYDRLIIQIENYPDYDISPYQREIISDYYFRNSWSFKYLFDYVIDVRILKSKLFHHDNIFENEDLDTKNFDLVEDLTKNLNIINQYDSDFFHYYGYEIDDLDEFKVRQIRIFNIDNTDKKIRYEGSFFGNNDDIDPIDWGIFSLLEIKGINSYLDNFYKELLSESYLLYINENFKLSFFICFSALENFINTQLNESDKEERLIDKIKRLYKLKFHNMQSNKIYTSIINDFDFFTNTRNTIAHGREKIEIEENTSKKFLIFTSIMITLYNEEINNFEELAEICQINSENK